MSVQYNISRELTIEEWGFIVKAMLLYVECGNTSERERKFAESLVGTYNAVQSLAQLTVEEQPL